MRKLKALLICTILLAQLFSGAVVFGAGSVTINGYTVYNSSNTVVTTSDSIVEGSKLYIELKLTNTTGVSISDISLTIDSDSDFYGINNSTFTPDNDSADNAESIEWTDNNRLYVEFDGTGKVLTYTLSYKIGANTIEEQKSMYISQALMTNNSMVAALVDTTQYKPKLSVSTASSALTFTAGTTATLTLPIENVSTYAADSVVVSLEMDKVEQILQDYNMTQNIGKILKYESRNAVFKLNLLPSAPEGTYAVQVNISFTNEFGNEMTPVTKTVYIKIQNDNTPPLLTVDKVDLTPTTAVPGENVDIKLNISNLGSLAAKDITVTLAGMKNEGFTLNNTTDVKYIKSIDGNNSATITYKLKASTQIPSGNNELQVKLSYSDGANNKLTAENQIFIPVSRTTTGKGLAIQNVQSPQSTVTSNNEFKIAFSLANKGLTDASNVKVSIASDKEIVCKSMNSYMLDTLAKGEVKKFEFTLFAIQGADTKNYPVSINVEYSESPGAAATTITQYVGVFVDNGASSKSVPRIIIDNYSYTPNEINSGDEFTLKMSYLNTSKTVKISNIKVTVSSDDGAFTPVNTSNTFFIDDLATKTNIEKSIVLKAKPGSDPKAYPLSVTFDYEDDKGNQYNTKETISIPVQVVPKLVTGDIALPTDAFAGQPTAVSVEFYNMGKVTLYNLMVKAEGDFQAQEANYYVGNFDAGKSDSFEAQITPNTAGEVKGNIVFTFEDVAGKTYEVKKDFTLNAIEMAQPVMEPGKMLEVGPDGKPITPGGAKSFNILYFIIPGVVVAAAVVTFIIIRKKRKARRELSLDE